jgi:hypothetical protein
MPNMELMEIDWHESWDSEPQSTTDKLRPDKRLKMAHLLQDDGSDRQALEFAPDHFDIDFASHSTDPWGWEGDLLVNEVFHSAANPQVFHFETGVGEFNTLSVEQADDVVVCFGMVKASLFRPSAFIRF